MDGQKLPGIRQPVVSRMEETLVRSLVAFFRRDGLAGLKILVASLAFGFVGALPLLLYAALGPKDGNPIGLGLLAVAAVGIALLGVAVGLLGLLVELVMSLRR